MASDVQICNRALGKLGASQITSFEDQTTEAILCKSFYTQLRDQVLEEGAWSFAIVVEALNQDPIAPSPEGISNAVSSNFRFRYLVPSNTLRIMQVNQDEKAWHYEDGYIKTNDAIVYMKSIKVVEDSSKFSPLFVSALVNLIASELAIPISRSSEYSNYYSAKYKEVLDDALTSDGLQGTSEYRGLASSIRVR